MSTAVLYTPQVLALAVELAAVPWDESLPFTGEARSASCGSTIAMALDLDGAGAVSRLAIRSQACAIGQAAAAIFVRGAKGRMPAELRDAGEAVARWLAGEGEMPAWPDLAIIAAARDYPGRHGAVMLPWKAASEALFTR